MYKEISFRIKGMAPIILHNGQMANPLNPIVQAIKQITSKRKKTDDDMLKLADLEYEGGLYLGEKGEVVIPGEIIEAMLKAAAKKKNKGKDFTAGVISDGNWPLIYDGPKSLAKLIADPKFRLMSMVKIGTSKVLRCRPMFKSWELEFVVNYEPSVIDESAVREAVETGGRIIGLCDWRPKYGRFEVI